MACAWANQRLAVHDPPEKLVQTPVFLLSAQRCPSVGNRRIHFGAIADDVGVGKQCFDLFGTKSRYLARIKLSEGGLKSFTLAQDRQPAQAALHRFEN